MRKLQMGRSAVRPTRSPGLAEAASRVGDRWSLLIVDALLEGERRFNELATAVAGIAPNILSARLKQLEHEGLVVSRPYSERPLRLVYELTGTGHDLAGALRMLASWGSRSRGDVHGARHAVCGGELDVRWWCPGCSEVVPGDESDLHWV